MSQNPSGLAKLDDSSTLSSDIYHTTEPQTLRGQQLARVNCSRAHADKRLAATQSRYKQKYDNGVRRIVALSQEQMSCIEKPSLAASSTKGIGRMATVRKAYT